MNHHYKDKSTHLGQTIYEATFFFYITYGNIAKNHEHVQRKLLNFENWGNREVSKSAKILCQKSSESFLFFFHWRISI